MEYLFVQQEERGGHKLLCNRFVHIIETFLEIKIAVFRHVFGTLKILGLFIVSSF